jgi:hypothetical protein
MPNKQPMPGSQKIFGKQKAGYKKRKTLIETGK